MVARRVRARHDAAMRHAIIIFMALGAAGCSTTRANGVVSLSAVDAAGRGSSAYSFAFVDPGTGKVVWSGVPAESSTVSNSMRGGSFRLLVLSGSGAAVMDVDVDGDTAVSARITAGGALRGEARVDGQPVTAQVWMPIPGKDSNPLNRLSHVVRAGPDGRFLIDRLPPGRWTIFVGTQAAGYKAVEVEITEGKVNDAGIIQIR